MKIRPSQKPGRVVVELAPKDSELLAEAAPTGAFAAPFKLTRILVPTDFSECSRKALRYAVPLAKQFGASITLLHVVQTYSGSGEFAVIDFPLIEKDLCEAGRKELAEFARNEIGPDIPHETVVRVGQTAHDIATAAKELAADLIVVSTHGRTGLKHVFMGSVTEHVVRYAPCPVLVVREHEHEFVVA